MSEFSVKDLLETMSLDGIEDVIEIIRSRDDVASVVLLTEKDLLAMAKEDERHVRGFMHAVQGDLSDEPA